MPIRSSKRKLFKTYGCRSRCFQSDVCSLRIPRAGAQTTCRRLPPHDQQHWAAVSSLIWTCRTRATNASAVSQRCQVILLPNLACCYDELCTPWALLLSYFNLHYGLQYLKVRLICWEGGKTIKVRPGARKHELLLYLVCNYCLLVPTPSVPNY